MVETGFTVLMDEAPETTLTLMALSETTRRELEAAGRKVRAAEKRLATAVSARDHLIRSAVQYGSLREVGAACGLSHTAVKFIAHGRNPR